MNRTSPRPRVRRAFTLVELLVVIAIIALLISILLPALSSARRQADRIKCASALRQIGMAFQMYSNTYKGFYPVAVHSAGNGTPYPRIPVELRWYDRIAPFITNAKTMDSYTDITKVRANSVLWGCPTWVGYMGDHLFIKANDDVRPGYGMQYYAPHYFDPPVTGTKFKTDYAYITTTGRGIYLKASQWGIRGAERGLIIDSMTHIVNVPGYSSYNYSAVTAGGWQPGPLVSGSPATQEKYFYTNNGLAFYVDAARHAKSGQKVTDRTKSMNMLFCDGHVDPVSVRDAWRAITFKDPG
jgi:prepilin-type N-terminal cleavage/methylation domain-containing protein/prepilin-type processing-associated H-X9-DG protein